MTDPIIVARLEILLDQSGNVTVNGPIGDRLLSYGLLEIAKETVAAYAAKANAQIKVPTAQDLAVVASRKM